MDTTTENAPKPLVLNFLENGTLGILTSCNSMSTQWKVEHNTLVTGNIASTMMACPDNAYETRRTCIFTL